MNGNSSIKVDSSREMLRIRNEEIPVKAIEKLEANAHVNTWAKNREATWKIACESLYEAVVTIKAAGGEVVWKNE